MNNMPVVNAAFSHKFDRLFRAYTQRQHIDLDEICTCNKQTNETIFTRRIRGLEKLSYSERLNILSALEVFLNDMRYINPRFTYLLYLLYLLGLETLKLNRRRVIFDLILYYKYLHGLVEINNCNFIRIYQSSRTRGDGIKLYKEQCSIDARHHFFSNRIVNVWNSLPAASVLSPVWLFLNEI